MLQEFVKHIAVANLCSAVFCLQGGSVARPALLCPLKLSFPSCLQKPSQRLGSWLTEFAASHAHKLCASISYLIHLLPLSATPATPRKTPEWQELPSAGLGNAKMSTITKEYITFSPYSVYLQPLLDVTFAPHTPAEEKSSFGVKYV